MTEMNYETILQSFLCLNLNIEQRFFKQTEFLDKEVEAQYRMARDKSSRRKKLYSDAFIIFCYIAIMFYIYIHDYGEMFAYTCLACLGLCLILIAFSYYKKNLSFNLFINYVMVHTLNIFLNFKVVYVALYINTPENDHDSEIIRTIIYSFVSSNILNYLSLNTRFSMSISFFLTNFFAALVAQMKSNQNYYYYLDGLTSLLVTLFFYMFKKMWEASDRGTFAERYRFEKFFHYTRDFIQGSNGYYLNISKDFSICCDSKMKTLLNEMQIDRNTGKFKNSEKLNETYESIDLDEVNNLMSFDNSTPNENYGNLSPEVLSLFTLYRDDNFEKENSIDTNENLLDKLKLLMWKSSSTTNFTCVGRYKVESLVGTKYFDVYFRKFCLNINNSINDIQIYDVTDLVASRQMLYESGTVKEKVLAKFIHEFKTPINSIIGVIGNIEDSLNCTSVQENKTMKNYLDTVGNLSRYVIYLISDIINFTNIKSLEEIKITAEKINLREIANFGFDILKSLLRCNKSKNEAILPILEFEDDIDNLNITADEIRLKQIILNIISNAVKFTKSGLIKISCSILTDIRRVVMSIEDTGIGIKQNEQERLFNDFYMVNNETINNAMGSGLGLSISKSLAASMNIDISIISTYGKGSQFSLAIPFEQDSFLSESLKNIVINEVSSELDPENPIQLQQTKLIREQFYSTDLSYHLSENKSEIRVPEFQITSREVK